MFYENVRTRIELLEKIGDNFDKMIVHASNVIVESLNNDGTLFFAGNGGSAAEAQHMSAEYLATLDHRNFRPGIRSIALTTDSFFQIGWTNDFGYEEVFARQLETLGRMGDVFMAYSTSGNSDNICKGIKKAKEKGLITIGFSGNKGGEMSSLCDLCFIVPSSKTNTYKKFIL